jgi:hypothetical protein
MLARRKAVQIVLIMAATLAGRSSSAKTLLLAYASQLRDTPQVLVE